MATRKTKQTPTSESHLTQRRFQNTAMPTNADETAPTSAPQPIAAEGATPITTLNIIPRSGLPPFPPFDPLSNRASLGLQWRKWRRRFENFAWVRPYYPQRPTRRVRRRGHKWHPLYFARLGIDYNTAIEIRGVGTPHMKGMGMLVGSFEKTPKGDRSGRGPSFFLTPKRDHVKTQTKAKTLSSNTFIPK